MAQQIPPELVEMADGQCGIVTKSQAIAAGLTRSVIASHVRYGRWQRLHPGVYATFTAGQIGSQCYGLPFSAPGPAPC
jgi:hypothetical protein